MLSRWTWLQIFIICILIVCFFLGEWFDLNSLIAITSKDDSVLLSMILTITFLILVYGSITLLLLLQAKKDKKLFNYTIWDKMYLYILSFFLLSSILFIVMVLFTSLVEWIDSFRSIFYIQVLFFLTLFYLLVLSLVYKFTEQKQNSDQILYSTFLWSMILTILFVFLLPGIWLINLCWNDVNS